MSSNAPEMGQGEGTLSKAAGMVAAVGLHARPAASASAAPPSSAARRRRPSASSRASSSSSPSMESPAASTSARWLPAT